MNTISVGVLPVALEDLHQRLTPEQEEQNRQQADQWERENPGTAARVWEAVHNGVVRALEIQLQTGMDDHGTIKSRALGLLLNERGVPLTGGHQFKINSRSPKIRLSLTPRLLVPRASPSAGARCARLS